MTRFAAKYARQPIKKEEHFMEKKPESWKQRGLFALLSRQSNSDVLGSYTGTPADLEDDEPVQDADDL